MKPIGPMMREHRLIERMLGVIERELKAIKAGKKADPVFIGVTVDFFRIYADRTHHGKEEEIYFRDLALKDIDIENRQIMDELVEEHIYARVQVRALLDANERYIAGEPGAVDELAHYMTVLISFYPGHIEKEDRRFFFPTQEYFSKEEQEAMLQEFKDFDARMIHEKYEDVVKGFES